MSTSTLTTERLTLRPWQVDDAQAALDVYSHAEVTCWLSPGMDRVPGLAAMRLLLRQWSAAATARNNGMHWVGETTKYFGAELEVYRLRAADLDLTAPRALQPLRLSDD